MGKIAVIFWSGTGNTRDMAEAVAEGINSNGQQADLINVSDISAPEAARYEKLALGCPSMGAEVLEESEFEPFFSAIESGLSGKKIALFGSYGWGDGQWMRDWHQRTSSNGALLMTEDLIINERPDSSGLDQCREFGRKFAGF
jgi:flavodoxin short chain